ncbi:MAG: hypothetical protein ACWA6Y_03120 [Polaromonas sp.]
MTLHRRLPEALTAYQAASDAPLLARLSQRIDESSRRFKAIETLIPGALRAAVKAGPIDDQSWCLLVNGNAAAAKVRQLLPLLQASLLRQGWKDVSIRLKILAVKRPSS